MRSRRPRAAESFPETGRQSDPYRSELPTSNSSQVPGTPRRLVGPSGANERSVPVTRSRTVEFTTTRPGVAEPRLRAVPTILGVAAGRRPERRPDLPRPAAEEERVGTHHLGPVVDLVLVVLDAQGPGVAPGPVLVEAGPLDDPVERHERGHHELHDTRLEGAAGGDGLICDS